MAELFLDDYFEINTQPKGVIKRTVPFKIVVKSLVQVCGMVGFGFFAAICTEGSAGFILKMLSK